MKKQIKKKRTPQKKARSKAAAAEKKIGIMGGAFNPIHVGHLNAAMTVLQKLGLDKVVFIPVLNPPHREISGPPAEERLKMIHLAIKPYSDQFECDDIEIVRGGESYTIDTLRSYAKTYGSENLYFIMGADAFIDFPTWKNFDELLNLSNFVVTTRPGTYLTLAAVDLPPGLQKFVRASDTHCVVLSTGKTIKAVDLVDKDVSSSKIRKKLRLGQDIRNQVPPAVADYIREKGFYNRASPLVADYRQFTVFCANRAFDKKALAVKVYDMSPRNSYTDYCVVCSATSTRHAAAIAEGIIEAAREEFGIRPLSLEGAREGLWVLIDFGSVIVHVFEDTVRTRYNIEGLMSKCEQIRAGFPQSTRL